jgi:hypothetical protein
MPLDVAEQDVPALARAFEDGAEGERWRALGALARIGTPETARLLEPFARRPCAEQALALAGVAWSAEREHADIVLAGLAAPSAEARLAATRGLVPLVTSDFSVPIGILLADDRPAARIATLELIGAAGLSGFFLDVARAARADDAGVREAALAALGRLPNAGARELFVELGGSAPGAGPQQATLDPAAAPIDVTAPSLALTALLFDPAAPLVERAAAALVLGHRGEAGPLEQATRLSPRLVRECAVLALAASGTPMPPDSVRRAREALEHSLRAHPGIGHPADDWLRALAEKSLSGGNIGLDASSTPAPPPTQETP